MAWLLTIDSNTDGRIVEREDDSLGNLYAFLQEKSSDLYRRQLEDSESFQITLSGKPRYHSVKVRPREPTGGDSEQ